MSQALSVLVAAQEFLLSRIAADAGCLVLIPLAAVASASPGRHPVAGLALLGVLLVSGVPAAGRIGDSPINMITPLNA